MKRYAISTECVEADFLPFVTAIRVVAQDFFALASMIEDGAGSCTARPIPPRVVWVLDDDVRKNVRNIEEYAAAFIKRFEPMRSRTPHSHSTQVPAGGSGGGAAGEPARATDEPEENDRNADAPGPGAATR